MSAVFFFYFFLFAFWLENVVGFQLTSIRGLSLLNISYYFLLFVWVVSIIKKRIVFERNAVNKYIIGLFIVIFFSIPVKFILNEVDDIYLLNELVSLKGWLNPVLLFFVIYNTVNNKKHGMLILFGLIFFFAVTILGSLAAYFGLSGFASAKIIKGRIAGFAEPNQFAAYLVLFFPLLLSGILFLSGSKRVLSLCFFCLALVVLLLTGSRGGILSLFFCIFVYFIAFSKKKLVNPVVLVVSIFVLVPIFFASSYVIMTDETRGKVISRLNPSETSDAYEYTSGRTELWRNGFQLFLESPLYGHGQATFTPLMKKKFPIWGNSHNDYLLYLVQYGIIGLIVFVAIFFVLFRESWRMSRMSHDRSITILALSYFSGLAGFALAAAGVNIIQPLYLFWAYSAVVLRQGDFLGSDFVNTSQGVHDAYC
ncbi:MAG: O-antigen ligase family protein [Desulfobulbus sp.]|jgi:oligosaccharide repeat unit polymerase